MKTKQNIDILLENGIHFSTLSTMTESQIRVLAEKAKKSKKKDLCPCGCEKDTCPCGPDCKKCDCGKSKKKETKEAKQITTTAVEYSQEEIKAMTDPNGNVTIPNKPIKEDSTLEDLAIAGESDGRLTPNEALALSMNDKGGDISEKFKSKAQQKLFFMKCGDGKTKEQKKWCKLRDEFASDTTKRDYKTMPDHVDDEKPKRKKPTSKKRRSTKKESYEKQLEDKIVEMIDNHINPAMTKGKLIKTINEKKSESFILRNPKKVTMFSAEEGIERKKLPITSLGMMDEDTETAPAPTKDPKTKPGTKNPGRRNPFKKPGPKEKPRAGENEKQKSDFMSLIKQVLNMS
jgi:hypothetical protein